MKPTPFALLVIVSSLICELETSGNAQSTAATPAPPPSAPAAPSASNMEKLAMPIALHPDPLIAIILPASVYPVEIVQAARFIKDTNNLAQLNQQPWDENVKAVARFPDVIAMMDADLAWTSQLGQAFIDHPKELMDAIQALRLKAQQAGTLQTTPQQIVYVTNEVIKVVPSDPEVIYVPTYTTTVYYPPPGYVYDPYAPLVTFGAGLVIGAIIASDCDWHGGGVWVGGGGVVIWGGGSHHHDDVDVDIDIDHNYNRPDRPDQRPGTGTPRKWQPDQNRLRNSGAPTTAQTREARGWSSGSTAQRPAGSPATRPAQTPSTVAGTQPSYNWSQKPAAGAQPVRTPGAGQQPAPAQRPAAPAQRPATPSAGTKPTTTWQQPASTRPAQQPAASTRPAQQPSYNRASQNSSAFSGVNSGGSARKFSSRGSSSRGGGRRR